MPPCLAKLLLLLVTTAIATKPQPCQPRKPWTEYTNFPFHEKCPGFPNNTPRFDMPLNCLTRTVEKEIALSIANGVFECDKWCVYSVVSDRSWIWKADQQCFTPYEGCRHLPPEIAVAIEQNNTLCSPTPTPKQDCVKLKQASELNIQTIRLKCKHYHAQYKPSFHSAVSCETGVVDGELAQALVNGGFSDCKNWCVFSIQSPTQLAWLWKPQDNCWTANNHCVSYQAERMFVERLKDSLCEEPCHQPIRPQLLSTSLLHKKCLNYNENHSPKFHSAVICGTDREDLELKFSLANFAFAECRNWCVYSLERTLDHAWQWDPKQKCWQESVACLSLESELAFAIEVRDALCLNATDRSLESRQRQRATQLPEDTGLWGDEKTQQDAVEMYYFFLSFSSVVTVLFVVLQFVVPPHQQPDNNSNNHDKID